VPYLYADVIAIQNPLPFLSLLVLDSSCSSGHFLLYRERFLLYPEKTAVSGSPHRQFAICSDPDTATLVLQLSQTMANDINDLDDSEALYYDDDLGGTIASHI